MYILQGIFSFFPSFQGIQTVNSALDIHVRSVVMHVYLIGYTSFLALSYPWNYSFE